MPLLDSFKVDHTRMNAPAVRVAKTMRTPKGDNITVFDLRFCIPNKEILPPKGIHTLEHLFAGLNRKLERKRTGECLCTCNNRLGSDSRVPFCR